MQPLIEILLINAASAALLALVVALIGRVVERPAVMHVLWLLVLLKLLAPPMVEIAALPRIVPARGLATATIPWLSTRPTSLAGAPTPAGLPPGLSADATVKTPRNRLAAAAVAIWLAGSALLLSLLIMRIVRFRRLLARSSRADVSVHAEAASIARRLGVPTCPRVRLVAGRVPPMIWGCLGRCQLLLPAGLVATLGAAERQALIAHELAHVRRHDPWARYVEIVATVLFWWHPVAWWARRELRRHEERSCDALVLETFPQQARAYARGLVETLDFLSVGEPSVPAVATGAVGARQLEERLTMIVNGTTPRKTTPAQRFLLATVVAGTLLAFPTWIDGVAAGDAASAPEEEAYAAELRALEEEAMVLEQRLRKVAAARMEIHAALGADRTRAELEAIERRAAEAEAAGRPEETVRLRAAAAEVERRLQREAELVEAELALMRERSEMDSRRHDSALELDRARAEEELARAEQLEARARDGARDAEADPRRDDDDPSHADEVRQRAIELKTELAHLERLMLETRQEMRRRQEILDQLRRELAELEELKYD